MVICSFLNKYRIRASNSSPSPTHLSFLNMRATLPRLVRIIPRSLLSPGQATAIPAPEPQYNDLHRPTVLDLLQRQRDDLIQKQKNGLLKEGEEWPSNIRIEVPLERSAFKNVRKELRGEIKKLFKER